MASPRDLIYKLNVITNPRNRDEKLVRLEEGKILHGGHHGSRQRRYQSTTLLTKSEEHYSSRWIYFTREGAGGSLLDKSKRRDD